ncbi:tetratricopeptide repeat protein [Polynucleobacter sp.]|uniref:tetratricopeptide repeat protein n=1 Tax=Polynucleobacter sp. TaxID=2029855 RepID=UPI003F699FE9
MNSGTTTSITISRILDLVRSNQLINQRSKLQEALCADEKNYAQLFEIGLALANASRFEDAIEIFSALKNYQNKDQRVIYNLGLAYAVVGDHLKALECYDQALQFYPQDIETLINKSASLIDLGEHEAAKKVLSFALGIDPSIPQLWMNQGIVLNKLKSYEDAVQSYDEVLRLDQNLYEAWSNRSLPLQKLNKFNEALDSCDNAIRLKPDYADAWLNKGVTCGELKRYQEAINYYDKAISLKPNYVEAWFNKGVTCGELKRYQEAINYYDKAISLRPDYAEAWHNKGVNCSELKRYEEAISHYNKAMVLKPNYAEAWYNKGIVFSELGRHQDALVCYQNAVAIKPAFDWLLGQLIHTKMLLCDWSGLDQYLIELRGRIERHEKVVQPFAALALFDSPRLHQIAADVYVQSKYLSTPPLNSISKKSAEGKIRIGYFSADFQDHPVSYLTAEMFELHDKNSFEVFAFSFGGMNSGAMRQRLKNSFDGFIEVDDKSDAEIALLSRNLGIDIAVDLGGHTQHARTGIFAHRAAPIQISYAGYLGTLSAKYMDYLVADKTIVTTNSLPYIAEKIIQLPSYQVNDRKKFQGDNRFSRADLGLPEDAFVFCCFNNTYKITPETFGGWMRILKAVDGSVLFLYSDNDMVRKNLKKEASTRGVNESRLIFGAGVGRDDYLARYQVADLFLDTAPYNAGTTASDALWVGLPVLTLIGESFPSRVAASILNAIGMPDLIALNQFEYECLGIELATKPEKLAEIKNRLVINRPTELLFDTPLFTKNIEKAYRKIHAQYCSGMSPEHIFIQ